MPLFNLFRDRLKVLLDATLHVQCFVSLIAVACPTGSDIGWQGKVEGDVWQW